MTNQRAGKTGKQWHSIIVRAQRETTRQLLILGEALYHMKEGEFYYDLGFDYWEQYVSQILGRGWRFADGLIRVHKWARNWDISDDLLVPYSKLLILERFVPEDKIDMWLQKAETMTVPELRAEAEKRRRADDNVTDLRRRPRRDINFGALLSKDENEVVRQAIDICKKAGVAATIPDALAVMAQVLLKHRAEVKKRKPAPHLRAVNDQR